MLGSQDSHTYLIPAAVIEVVVGGNCSDNLYASIRSGLLHLENIVGVDGSGTVGRRGIVNEQVRVVVIADGDRYDLHGAAGG